MAALLVDSFTGRGIRQTITNQSQLGSLTTRSVTILQPRQRPSSHEIFCEAFRVEDPFTTGTDIGPLSSEAQFKKVE
jgi:hypothetical protein